MSQSQTSLKLDELRRAAKRLAKAYATGDASARQRLRIHPPRPKGADLSHADFLHVIALEQNFASWPALKLAAETVGLDRAALQQRLKIALAHGQNNVVAQLLAKTPDLADGVLGAQIALYDLSAVSAALHDDPKRATQALGPRSPMVHLCFSRWHQAQPERRDDMLAIAAQLVAHGADVNDSIPVGPESDHRLSVLYGAIGHADNMVLGKWLLEAGADPNDGESLYHATELGHHQGLDLLLAHGADPKGTNALLRAMDFNDHVAVQKLIAAGADVNEFTADEIGGERPWVIPALHQAARRLCDQPMIDLLLAAGANPALRFEGATAYGFARAFGNKALAEAIEKQSRAPELTPEEALLAKAADGVETPGEFINPDKLPESYRLILRNILHLPDKADHVRRLVALGLEYDRPDQEGLTPVQVAGWEGLPDMLGYFLRLSPDLSHVNDFGGTLLSTIIHGSENNPNRAGRDYLACLKRALEEGVALPRRAIELAGEDDIADFLAEWAVRHPGQVIEGGLG